MDASGIVGPARHSVLIGTDFSGFGGGERFLLEIGLGLKSLGWRVTITAPRGALCKAAREQTVNVWEVEARLRRRHLAELVDSIGPDVVLLCSYGPLTRALSRAARRRRIPVCLRVDALVFPGGVRSRAFVSTASWISVPSPTVLRNLRGRASHPNVTVIPSVPNDARMHAPTRAPFQGRASTTVTVGWVGRLDPVKRLEDAVAAFAGLCRSVPDARLRVAAGSDSYGGVSAGGYRTAVMRLAESRGVTRRIELLEDVPDIYAFLDEVDVSLSTSERETFCRSVFEAMLMARPVVSTRAGAVADLISDGKDGVLVEVGDVSAIEAALVDLVANPRRALRLGQAARQSALELASTGDVARTAESLAAVCGASPKEGGRRQR